jgi:hypothetical protein
LSLPVIISKVFNTFLLGQKTLVIYSYEFLINTSSVLAKLVVRLFLLFRSVFNDLLLHIFEGLKKRRAQSSQNKNNNEFNSVLNSNKKAVKSQVLIESIS